MARTLRTIIRYLEVLDFGERLHSHGQSQALAREVRFQAAATSANKVAGSSPEPTGARDTAYPATCISCRRKTKASP